MVAWTARHVANGNPQAGLQPALHHMIGAHPADLHVDARFTVVLQDLSVGASVEEILTRLTEARIV